MLISRPPQQLQVQALTMWKGVVMEEADLDCGGAGLVDAGAAGDDLVQPASLLGHNAVDLVLLAAQEQVQDVDVVDHGAAQVVGLQHHVKHVKSMPG